MPVALPQAKRFNPLPPPKRGETAREGEQSPLRGVSIHSPRRSEGRLHRRLGLRPKVRKFQSTPPAEARGDAT